MDGFRNGIYVLGLPEGTRRDYSFDICESLLEQKSNHFQVNETEARLKNHEICSDKQIEKSSTAEFFVNVLSNDPENSKYFRWPPSKGIRTNFFYINDATTADINADDNGAYNKTRHTTKLYYPEVYVRKVTVTTTIRRNQTDPIHGAH